MIAVYCPSHSQRCLAKQCPLTLLLPRCQKCQDLAVALLPGVAQTFNTCMRSCCVAEGNPRHSIALLWAWHSALQSQGLTHVHHFTSHTSRKQPHCKRQISAGCCLLRDRGLGQHVSGRQSSHGMKGYVRQSAALSRKIGRLSCADSIRLPLAFPRLC